MNHKISSLIFIITVSTFGICTAQKFEPSWESLRQYKVPEWFKDAKFGIFMHWGVQSVPAYDGWYARDMYMQGGETYEHHLAHYGHPSKFGYKVAAIGRGSENASLAKKLGASVYIDSQSTNAAVALQKLGGAQVILATAPSSKAMSELVDGLGPNGKLMVIGATFDPIEVTPIQLINGSRAIQGWSTGTPADSEDTLRFAELSGVRPMIEKYPLEKAAEAYARMLSGKAQFRVVLTM